jgi:hypothetical protein
VIVPVVGAYDAAHDERRSTVKTELSKTDTKRNKAPRRTLGTFPETAISISFAEPAFSLLYRFTPAHIPINMATSSLSPRGRRQEVGNRAKSSTKSFIKSRASQEAHNAFW